MLNGEFHETFIVVLASLFALVDPFGNAVIFASLTPTRTPYRRRLYAIKGVLIATLLLIGFMFLGQFFLTHLGISLPALRTAGGILLLILGIDMVYARNSGGTGTTDEETLEARTNSEAKGDISVFPLATPLLAGPGTIGAVILFRANAGDSAEQQAAVVTAILVIMLASLACLLASAAIARLLGTTGLNVINRIMGVLLAALAVQFIFDGVQNGLLAG